MTVPQKILIIRMSSIGDVLLVSPLIRVLKQKYPDCQIDFVIKQEYFDLVVFHPNLTHIFVFNKKKGFSALKKLRREIKEQHYDLIIDIHKNLRSYFLRINTNAGKLVKYKKYAIKRWLLVNLKINLYHQIVPVEQRYINSLGKFGVVNDNRGLDLFIPSSIAQKISSQWNDKLTGKHDFVFALAPGASFLTKRWHVEGFKEVIDYLTKKYNIAFLLLGNKQDREITNEIAAEFPQHCFNVAGDYSILETAALLNYAQLTITNDTGLMHIAAALKKKVVAIFGSTTEELGFFPYTTQSIVVQNKNITCRPCSHVGKHFCPRKHFKCMKDITAGQVIAAVEKLINN